MKICTIGLGYIGLPTSIMFAKHDVKVVGVDVKEDVVNLLNEGIIHIKEPGLQEALNEVIDKGTFKASTKPEKANVFIIAVPTPNNNDLYKSCDLTFVLDAVNSVIPYLEKGNVVIVESTIAPRTMDDYVKPLIEEKGFIIGEDIYLVHCPERVLPGQILHELVHNNRIVGGVTPKCTEAGTMVYSTFVKGEIIKTDAKTAEMSKLMENTYRDVNIALANELTKISNELGVNALKVIEMANKHPRVNLHTPGPGVGGHCLAVDPYFIVSKAPETAKLINLSRQINNSMPSYVIENVNKIMQSINGKKISVLGLAYKGNVDDIRQSPAMEIYNELLIQGNYEVSVFDPHVKVDFVCKDISETLYQSDLILVLTNHNEFKELNNDLLKTMNNKIIFDTVNIVNSSALEEGINYFNYGNLFEFNQRNALVLD